MNKEQAVSYLRFSGFSDEQIKAIEGAFTYGDCISREAVKYFVRSLSRWCVRSEDGKFNNVGLLYDDVMFGIDRLPSVNPQKPICPSAGVDCEDCPAYEDAISRRAVLNTLERMDKALDEDRTVENYKELLRECYKVLPSVRAESEDKA
jgi:hypothetical protein